MPAIVANPSVNTTTVARGEILYGIRLLSDGKRRRGLWDAAKKIFDEDFADQVLSFDSDAADMYAEIAASRRTTGKPISQFDAMIVTMARSRGASLATRNAKDFEGCGVDVINPWMVYTEYRILRSPPVLFFSARL